MSYLRAKFPFEAENEDEISFEKGDYLMVEKVVDGDWLSGRIVRKDGGESKSGLFPKNYCKEVDKLPWVTKAVPAKVEVEAKAAFAFGMCLSLSSYVLVYVVVVVRISFLFLMRSHLHRCGTRG